MPTVRRGKTAKDRRNGAAAKAHANRAERVAWQQDSQTGNEAFPWHTCNGQKNRFKHLPKCQTKPPGGES